MEKLMEYTGGIIIMAIALISLMAISCVIGIVRFIYFLSKNENIARKDKITYILLLISIIILSLCVGKEIGYYLGILQVL